MRFTINREEFLKALNVATKPIPSKSFVASLVFLKLTLNENGLNLVGSNETIAISLTIPFSINDKEIIRNYKEGSILVQGRYLNEIVRKLVSEELTFELIDNSVVEITSDRSSFQLNCAQSEEYPEYDFNENGVEFDISSKELTDLVDQTAFAAANKENRPMLTALNVVGENNKITALALDSARYSRKEIEVNLPGPFTANIPAKTISEIVRMFEGNKDIHVVVNERKMLFKFANTVISSNLLNGEYPNVKNLVPKAFSYSLEINANELMAAIDRVSLLSNEKNTVKLTMNQNEVEISSTTNEAGSATEKLSNFQFNGDRFEILFNGTYVVDGIKALRSDDIIIEFVAEMKPFVIKNAKDEHIIQLITPVRA